MYNGYFSYPSLRRLAVCTGHLDLFKAVFRIESSCKMNLLTTLSLSWNSQSTAVKNYSRSFAMKKCKASTTDPELLKNICRLWILDNEDNTEDIWWNAEVIEFVLGNEQCVILPAPLDTLILGTIKNVFVWWRFWIPDFLPNLSETWTLWMILMIMSQFRYLMMRSSLNGKHYIFNAAAFRARMWKWYKITI